MTIQEIYNLAVQKAIEADGRGKEQIENNLKRIEAKYRKMSDEEKEEFDQDRLQNPFSDSRILFGDVKKEVKKIMVGIDIDGEELMLADKLGDIDLVISHHPRGRALANLSDVMQLQIDLLAQSGVPVNIAERLLKKRIGEVARGVSPSNHNKVVDIARLLNMPLMCLHTVCDNLAAKFIDEKLKEEKPVLIEDVMKFLKKIPEYKEAIKSGLGGPKIFVGNEENRVGKYILTEMTGGTEGAPEIYEKLANVGIGTIVGMHMSEKHREEAEKANINVVVAGHMPSDSLGLNLFFDELEKRGITILPCSGFIRISRV